jgi:hypothetical protein
VIAGLTLMLCLSPDAQAVLANLIERMADGGDDFDGCANWLRSSAEQLAALEVEAMKVRAELRIYFGLDS